MCVAMLSIEASIRSEGAAVRKLALLLVTLVVPACTGPSQPLPTDHHGPAPPSLSITATAQVISNGSGALDLEVRASLQNATTVHFQVADPGRCPLFVQLFSNPTGEAAGSLDASMACPSGTPTFDLAPGDSAVLTRVLRAADLAAFSPGKYGINVVVTTSTVASGVWAGNVDLPLVPRP
jgi:hypothetical protein